MLSGYLTILQAARFKSISRQTIYNWIKAKKLKGYPSDDCRERLVNQKQLMQIKIRVRK